MPARRSLPQPQPVPPELLHHARESRHAPTAAEKRLWAGLRAHRLGTHVRRQHPIGDHFIVDFFCADARLCIEIDGDTHAELGMPEYDAERTALLEARGYRVIRFSNQEVLTNLPAVVDAIRAACQPLPPQPAS